MSKKNFSMEEAKEIDPNAEPGDIVEEDVTPPAFGRIAAQTAKQVILQRIREAEKETIFSEYKSKEGMIIFRFSIFSFSSS